MERRAKCWLICPKWAKSNFVPIIVIKSHSTHFKKSSHFTSLQWRNSNFIPFIIIIITYQCGSLETTKIILLSHLIIPFILSKYFYVSTSTYHGLIKTLHSLFYLTSIWDTSQKKKKSVSRPTSEYVHNTLICSQLYKLSHIQLILRNQLISLACNKDFRACLDFQFPSPITLFLSPITQNMWVPWLNGLFGGVFSFYFHHSILWFLSDELWKLKTHFRCFQVMKTELWWYFCKYTHIEGPTVRPFALSNIVVFFFFLSFTLGLDHLSIISSSSSFLSFSRWFLGLVHSSLLGF